MAQLYFYYSSMNAGKSTSLLQAAHNYEEQGMNVMVFTPCLDTRGGSGTVESRIGLTREGIAFHENDNFLNHVMVQKKVIHCVLVDEAQFLSPAQVLQLTILCDEFDIPVLCYGLRTDFQGELFEGSKYLLAWADNLVELKTICTTGRKATMVVRLNEKGDRIFEGDQIQIGTNYLPVSRAEFNLQKYSLLARGLRNGV